MDSQPGTSDYIYGWSRRCQVIHLMKKVICLSVLACFFYPEKAYQGHLIVLVDKTNYVFHENHRVELIIIT